MISLTNYGHGCIGGGASDIRLEKDDLYHRVIVAGAGGGASGGTSDIFENGGDAGGIEGERGYFDQDHTIYTAGGSQTSPGETHGVHCVREGYPGEFGKGGGTYNGCGTNYGGSGGGGWFGGAGGGHRISGAGGSGYAFNPTSHVPHGFLLKKSFYLINAQVLGGKSDFPSASPEFDLDKHETGHIGNGATRITFLGRIRTSFVKKDIHKLVLIFIMITVVC